MIPEGVGPLSRPYAVRHVPPDGVEVLVEAGEGERRLLATDLGLLALHALEGRFRIAGSPDRIRVTGLVTARTEQTCVVTLESFDSSLREKVDVEFVDAHDAPGETSVKSLELDADHDAPEVIINGRIDLGSLTAEFLALGLDPHPRKPGAAFADAGESSPEDHPFAALAKLIPDRA